MLRKAGRYLRHVQIANPNGRGYPMNAERGRLRRVLPGARPDQLPRAASASTRAPTTSTPTPPGRWPCCARRRPGWPASRWQEAWTTTTGPPRDPSAGPRVVLALLEPAVGGGCGVRRDSRRRRRRPTAPRRRRATRAPTSARGPPDAAPRGRPSRRPEAAATRAAESAERGRRPTRAAATGRGPGRAGPHEDDPARRPRAAWRCGSSSADRRSRPTRWCCSTASRSPPPGVSDAVLTAELPADRAMQPGFSPVVVQNGPAAAAAAQQRQLLPGGAARRLARGAGVPARQRRAGRHDQDRGLQPQRPVGAHHRRRRAHRPRPGRIGTVNGSNVVLESVELTLPARLAERPHHGDQRAGRLPGQGVQPGPQPGDAAGGAGHRQLRIRRGLDHRARRRQRPLHQLVPGGRGLRLGRPAPPARGSPSYQITFPTPQTVGRIALRGNREYTTGYDFLRARFEVLGAEGARALVGRLRAARAGPRPRHHAARPRSPTSPPCASPASATRARTPASASWRCSRPEVGAVEPVCFRSSPRRGERGG